MNDGDTYTIRRLRQGPNPDAHHVVDDRGHPIYNEHNDQPAVFADEDAAQECADRLNQQVWEKELAAQRAQYDAEKAERAAGYPGGKIEVIERLDAIDPPYVWEYAVKMVMPDGREIEGIAQGEDIHRGGEIYADTFEPES